MADPTVLSDAMENYLEVILDLETENKVARTKDVALRLGIKPGSASGAIKALAARGLIDHERYGFITLTTAGRRIAKDVADRHAILKDFLTDILQIPPDTAEETACRMEHALDDTTRERLVCFIKYIHACPRAGEEWLQSFVDFCQRGGTLTPDCDQCIDQWKAEH